MTFDIFMNWFNIITTIISIVLTIIGLMQSSNSLTFITQHINNYSVNTSYDDDYYEENYQTKKSIFSFILLVLFGIFIIYITINFLYPQILLSNSSIFDLSNLKTISSFYYDFEKHIITFSIIISVGLILISAFHKRLANEQKIFFCIFYFLSFIGFFILSSTLKPISIEDIFQLFASPTSSMFDITPIRYIAVTAYIILSLFFNLILLHMFIISIVFPFTLTKSLKKNLTEYSVLAILLFFIFIPIIFFNFFV